MPPSPQPPEPQIVMTEMTNRVNELIELGNKQASAMTKVLNLPASLPTLPKVAPLGAPPTGTGSSSPQVLQTPFGKITLPTLPFALPTLPGLPTPTAEKEVAAPPPAETPTPGITVSYR